MLLSPSQTASRLTLGARRATTAPLALALLLTFGASACTSALYGRTGAVITGYAHDHMVPHLMGDEDVGMACQMGAALTGFVASFERVGADPDLAAVVSFVGAGMCAEEVAREAELRQVRAVRAGNASEAQDAAIVAGRAHFDAARRFLRAYQRAERRFGAFGGACPKVSDDEEVVALLALSAGMMAVLHDRGARGAAGVPMTIPPVVARAAACLDDGRWWGVPSALRAAVWMTVPGAGPASKEGQDPLAPAREALEAAAKRGDAAGIRLARALQVVGLTGAGDEAGARAAIAAHAAALQAKAAPARWRLLDGYATLLSRHEADRIWSHERGHRSPGVGIAELPAAPEAPSREDESVLDGIE